MGDRRGAIVVMTGVFIIAIMVISAISVDASRIFAAKNELQTAADAAALAGAVQLLEDSSTAADSALAYAARNRVEQDSILSVEVERGVWHPAERSFEAGAEPWDAVRVTAQFNLPLSLARVFGDSTVTVTSSAVAWSSAPIAETGCAKPLAVPYGRLLEMLRPGQGWTGADLTDDDIRRLREMPIADRRLWLPYGSNPADSTWYNYPNDDEYFPVDIDSSWVRGNSFNHERDPIPGNDFRSYMVGPPTGRCSRTVSPGDEIRSEPGSKINAIRDGIEDLCGLQGGTFNGFQCVRDGDPVDIPMKVVFWDDQSLAWHNPNRVVVRAKLTGSFVFEEIDLDGSDLDMQGALLGYFDVVRDFGVVDDTAPSTLVRPVLVR